MQIRGITPNTHIANAFSAVRPESMAPNHTHTDINAIPDFYIQ